jgi:hypothetical protein
LVCAQLQEEEGGPTCVALKLGDLSTSIDPGAAVSGGGGAHCAQGGQKRGGGSGWGRPICGPARSGAHLKVMQGFNEWVRPEKQLKFKFDFQIESKLIHSKMNLPKL